MNEPKNIIIDACMHLGDLIHASSVIPVIKSKYPKAKITFLVTAGLESLFDIIDDVDAVIPYKYKSGGGVLDVYRKAQDLKPYHFDMSISLDPRPRLAIMMWLAGIPNRIGSPSVFGWKPGIEKHFFTKFVDFGQYDVNQYPAAYNFQHLVKCAFDMLDDDHISMPCFKRADQESDKYIEQAFKDIPKSTKKIALCVNTVDEARNLGATFYHDLAKRLIEEHNATIVGVGVKADEVVFNQVIQGIDSNRIVNMIGKTNFKQLNALFAQCDLLINPDNGMGHFAAASGCPTVTIFTNAKPDKFKPLHPETKIVTSNCECMGMCDKHRRKVCGLKCREMISVDMVMDAVNIF